MKITEENFVFQLTYKNEEALQYVLQQYGWIVKTVVKKHLYSLESYQEECINDILLGVWNNIGSFDPSKNSFKNWIAGVSKYKALNYVRKYHRELEYENVDEIAIPTEEQSYQEIMKRDLDPEVAKMLECLKEQDRELFIRLYVEEQDMDEVTQATGLSRDVIYNRLSRAKKKIKEHTKR